MVASALPARADDTAANNRSHETAKRSTASLGTGTNSATSANQPAAGFTNGFVYTPSPQPVLLRGRLNVGKSGVYVPYYGNVGNDPLHSNVQGGVAGIGYGFHSWDISVINGAAAVPAVPGSDPPKANPSLSFAIHF